MEKIKMTTPIVEMDGDEMTRVIWQKIKDILILPYVDLNTMTWDLKTETKQMTGSQLTAQTPQKNTVLP